MVIISGDLQSCSDKVPHVLVAEGGCVIHQDNMNIIKQYKIGIGSMKNQADLCIRKRSSLINSDW